MPGPYLEVQGNYNQPITYNPGVSWPTLCNGLREVVYNYSYSLDITTLDLQVKVRRTISKESPKSHEAQVHTKSCCDRETSDTARAARDG